MVIDTETTGLGAGARVVEFACEVIDHDGRSLARYATLVDPQQTIGATKVHGITGADVAGAPTFSEVARVVARYLSDAVPVAHNLAFDWNVIRREFARLGLEVPVIARGVCTADLSFRKFGQRLTLRDACRQFGIDLKDPHQAAVDVAATKQLFLALRRLGAALPPVVATGPIRRTYRLPPSRPPHVRRVDPPHVVDVAGSRSPWKCLTNSDEEETW